MIISYGRATSPVGRLLIASTPRGACAVELGGSEKAWLQRLRTRFPRAALRPDAKAAAAAGRALASSRLTLDARGTPFQVLVWNALKKIPAGTTKTYGQIAREIGRPRAVRAVARAIATNSIAIAIPCHRVVGAGGKLGGYRWGTGRKRRLLAREAA